MAEIFYESYYGITPQLGDSIMHYQVKGAKHGVRRYQNEDGSLTPLGRDHYGVGQPRDKVRTDKDRSSGRSQHGSKQSSSRKVGRLEQFERDWEEGRAIARQEKAQKKAAKKEERSAAIDHVKNAIANASKKMSDRQIARVINRANPEDLKKFASRMSTAQLSEFNKRLGIKKDIESSAADLGEAKRRSAAARNEIQKLDIENRKAARKSALEAVSNTVDAVGQNAGKIYDAYQSFMARKNASELKAYESGEKMETARNAYNKARHTREENEAAYEQEKADRKAGITPEMRARVQKAVETSMEYSNRIARDQADKAIEKAKKMGLGGEATQKLVNDAIHKVWGGKGEWQPPNKSDGNDKPNNNQPNNNNKPNNNQPNNNNKPNNNQPNNNGNKPNNNQPNNNGNKPNNQPNNNQPNNSNNQSNNNQPNNSNNQPSNNPLDILRRFKRKK